jgi:hypothetical protein
MVDEYQDTNRLQAEIVRLLAHSHENVMAVGMMLSRSTVFAALRCGTFWVPPVIPQREDY